MKPYHQFKTAAAAAGTSLWRFWKPPPTTFAKLVTLSVLAGLAAACGDGDVTQVAEDWQPRLTVAGSPIFPTEKTLQVGMEEVTGAYFPNRVPLGCTANDVRLFATVLDPGQDEPVCFKDEVIPVLNIVADVISGAKDRFDIGFYIARDRGVGESTSAKTGPTNFYWLEDTDGGLDASSTPGGQIRGPNMTIGANGQDFYDKDGDVCGDTEQNVVNRAGPIQLINTVCQDTDAPGEPGFGLLDIGSCVAWDNNANTAACNDSEAIDGTNAIGVPVVVRETGIPNTKSKCTCEPLNIPITVLEGAKIEVIKDTDPEDFGGQDWELFIDKGEGLPPATLADPLFEVSSGPVGDGGTTGAGGAMVFAGTQGTPGATHTVQETFLNGVDPNAFNTSLSCVDRGQTTFNGGPPLTGSGVGPHNVSVDPDDDIVCTFTNEAKPKLTLTKTVNANNGGTASDTDWTLVFAGPDNGEGIEGNANVTGAVVDIGTYTLSEKNGPTGYSSNGIWSCSGGGTFTSPNQIALAAGDDVTCDITNTDDPPFLTLTKEVTNDDGGTALDTEWTLVFDGPNATDGEGIEGSPAVTAAEVVVGTYTLSEKDGPAGYSTNGVWSCTGDGTFTSPDKITLALGESASCEITNDDNPGSLTLLKKVDADNGGTAADTDWTLVFSGPVNGEGVEGSPAVTAASVEAGMYTLSEKNGPAGYSSTGIWSCSGDGTFTSPDKIQLALGESATCEITNTDDPPFLTLTKKVINLDGGTASDTDWTLVFDGPGATDGEGIENSVAVTAAEVVIGTYTLSEKNGPAGYSTDGIWSCTGDGTFTSPDKITLALGESASCEITNDDNPASLTLLKKVDADNGGTAADTDWTLVFSGPVNGEGVEGSAPVTSASVQAGMYTLSEKNGPAGYSSNGVWSCSGDGTFTSPDKIQLALGESATCEITNTDDPPFLTLTKKVENDNGGLAMDTDWTLVFDGPGASDGEGVEGDAAVTTAEVQIGTYTLSEKNGPSGYSSDGVWSCTGDGTFTSPNQIELGLGESASCEITNTDDPPMLTLTKAVVNDDGGGAADTDWTLVFNGPVNGEGTEGSAAVTNAVVSVGTYTLSEKDGPSGYTSDGVWVCTGDGTFNAPNQITLGLGESASCEITNDDIEVCKSGERLTSVSLQVFSANPDPLQIAWTDDNGNLSNADILGFVASAGTAGPTQFTIVPTGTFFDSQNLRFYLGPVGADLDQLEPSNLKVHLSCSDTPFIGQEHSGSANGFSVTLKKTGFVSTLFN